MNASCHHFELLHYVWLEGYINNLLDECDRPIVFDSVEEVLAELQDDFDIWAEEIRTGERQCKEKFDTKEFMVRCVETDARCGFMLVNRKLVLVSDCQFQSKQDLERINSTGLF